MSFIILAVQSFVMYEDFVNVLCHHYMMHIM